MEYQVWVNNKFKKKQPYISKFKNAGLHKESPTHLVSE